MRTVFDGLEDLTKCLVSMLDDRDIQVLRIRLDPTNTKVSEEVADY